jgi:hypothetical protein
MPCLLALLALFVPRLVILGLWFFTPWFEGLFNSILFPLLGFIFLPTSLLWYTVVLNVFGGEWGVLQIVVAVIALLIDLSPSTGRRRK